MNQHQPATLFKRTVPLKDGGSTIIWYYYVTVNGNRRRFSLGTSSKTAARAQLAAKIRTDSLLPATSSPHRFADFTTCMFLWEHCPLTARKRLRGDRISPHWVNQNRTYLVRHLLPVFGHQLLTDLTPVMIENFMFRLRDKKQLAPKTINLILSCLKAILAEAVRSTILQHNPAADVQPLRNQRVVRGKFLSLRNEDFVMAAKISALPQLPIIFRHLIPSFLSYILVSLTLAIPGMILVEKA